MDAVKPPAPHLAALCGGLLDALRRDLVADEPTALRPSHHRLLDNVPPGGRPITDLAAALGMTKQGAGQLVAALEASGLVAVRPDAADGRRRVVVRTAAGDRRVAELQARLEGVERRWARAVGQERYAVFRAVVEELGRPAGQASLDSP